MRAPAIHMWSVRFSFARASVLSFSDRQPQSLACFIHFRPLFIPDQILFSLSLGLTGPVLRLTPQPVNDAPA
jgi:hypothetical protein